MFEEHERKGIVPRATCGSSGALGPPLLSRRLGPCIPSPSSNDRRRKRQSGSGVARKRRRARCLALGVVLSGALASPVCRLREGCHGLRAHEFLLREGEVALRSNEVRNSRARGWSAKALPSRSAEIGAFVGASACRQCHCRIPWGGDLVQRTPRLLFVLKARRARRGRTGA